MRTRTLLSVLTLSLAIPHNPAQAAVCPPDLALDVALVEDLTIAANVNEWQTLFLDAYVPNGTFMVYVQLEAEYDSSTLSDAFFLEARQQGEAQ